MLNTTMIRNPEFLFPPLRTPSLQLWKLLMRKLKKPVSKYSQRMIRIYESPNNDRELQAQGKREV